MKTGVFSGIRAVFFDFGDTLSDGRISGPAAEDSAVREALRICRTRAARKIEKKTLIAARQEAEARRETAIRAGRELDSQTGGEFFLKSFAEGILHLMKKEPSREEIDNVYRAYLRGLVRAPAFFGDIRAVLSSLSSRFSLGIISNNMVEYVAGPLKFHNLEQFFKVLVVSGAEGCVKPEPDIFKLALARAGVNANEAVMVGDSYREDVLGGKEAGMLAVWMNRSNETAGATLQDATVSKLSEIPTLLGLTSP